MNESCKYPTCPECGHEDKTFFEEWYEFMDLESDPHFIHACPGCREEYYVKGTVMFENE